MLVGRVKATAARPDVGIESLIVITTVTQDQKNPPVRISSQSKLAYNRFKQGMSVPSNRQ